MADSVFRLVCVPTSLAEVTPEWAHTMLAEGEIAIVPDTGGLDAVGALAHRLDLVSVTLLRGETNAEAQDGTVIAYAGASALVWIAPAFTEPTQEWARARGAMTLLVESGGALGETEQRRIERFVATLGRQSE